MRRVVVVGGGPAGHRLIERLHRWGRPGLVTLLGAEPQPPYNRMLLPAVLDQTLPPPVLTLPRLPDGVRVRSGVRVTRIDRSARLVHTDDGQAYRYHRLVLATGARPRIPRIPGLREAGGLATGVRAVRTLASCQELPAGPVTVLGAGVLGVEVALAMRRRGHDVTLVHHHPYPMEKHLDAAAGELLVRHLRERGVVVHLSQRATRYQDGQLRLAGGADPAPGPLLLCAGARPDVALARAAGLAVARGIVVDDRLRTTDPYIHAIGDCAQHGRSHAPTATAAWAQADTLAELLAGGEARYHPPRPVVRLKDPELDTVCLGRTSEVSAPSAGVEQVTLTDQSRGRHAALAVRDGRITGAVLYGLPRAIAAATELYDRDLPLPADRLALLLGAAPRTGQVELPDDALVCVCNTVTKAELVQAWHQGCRDLGELAAATRATTGCGNCAPEVRRICGSLAERTPAAVDGSHRGGPADEPVPASAGSRRPGRSLPAASRVEVR